MDRNPDQTTTHRPADRSGRRRVALAALAGLLAVGAGAVAVGATGGGSDDDTATVAPVESTTTSVLDDELVLVDAPVNPAPAPKGEPAPQPPAPQPPAEQPPAEQPPAEEPPAEEPPAEQPPAVEPGVIDVDKTVFHQAPNKWGGKFRIHNVGASALEWTWTPGAVGITVTQSSGSLQPGEFVEVTFAIDHTILPAGPFAFANTVTSGDQVVNVHIDGTKTIAKNPGIELPDLDLGPNS
jgi:hypothetical protein